MDSSAPSELQKPVPYRIRIGVSGQGDLPPSAELSALLSQVLDEKLNDIFDDVSRDALRQSQHTPVLLSIVSPLASGGDRTVALEVLKRDGARLDAVIPLVLDDYLGSFAGEESRRGFLDLLSKCRQPHYLRHRQLDQDFATDQIDDARRRAFADVGRYVVDHCDVLIALCDGELESGVGNADEAVRYAQEQGRPLIRIRPGDANPLQISKGNGLNAKSIVMMDEFNSYVVEPGSKAEVIARLEQDGFGELAGPTIPEPVKEAIRQILFPFYLRASVIAKENQKRYRRAGTYGYLLPSVAVASVALATLIPEISLWAFVFELAILAITLFIIGAAHRRRSAEKWLESRFLTERLRAAIYMAGCGVEVATIAVPPHMAETEQPDDWMLRVFEEIWNRMPRMQGCGDQYCEALRGFIAEQWVESQIKFHDGKASTEGSRGAWLYLLGRILLFLTVGAAALHILVRAMSGRSETHPVVVTEKFLTFVALVFPAVASAFAGLRSHREHHRLEKRSRNMSSRLRQLKTRVSRTTTAADFERVLREIEATMLQEAQDWLMLMRMVTIEST